MITGSPWIVLIAVVALLEYLVIGGLVGRARVKYKIEAPATTGDPIFERYFRVHQNSLEALIVFIPCLWVFSLTVSLIAAIVLGIIFILARIAYAVGYISAPARREVGAGLTFLINGVFVIGSIVGILVYAL